MHAVMLRLALVLFVTGIAASLVGLVTDGGTVALIARIGFYVLVPLAIVVALVGLVRAPKRSISDGDARAGP